MRFEGRQKFLTILLSLLFNRDDTNWWGRATPKVTVSGEIFKYGAKVLQIVNIPVKT
jgi:hypothetical protein